MKKGRIFKNTAILISPLFAFALLLVPYSWANQAFVVDWFGCGCPKLDEMGELVQPDFNANDFTALFWLIIALCVIIASVFHSKRIPKAKTWLRIVYLIAMIGISLLIANKFSRMMMWL